MSRTGCSVPLRWAIFVFFVWMHQPPVSGQILQRLDPPAVDLAADRIEVWSSEPDRHWVVLSGRVSVAQDGEGLRADEAVVLVEPGKDGQKQLQRIEVKAAGNVRLTSRPASSLERTNLTFRSKLPVRLKPYEQGGMRQTGPDKIDQGKLIGAFGDEARAAIELAMSESDSPPAAMPPLPDNRTSTDAAISSDAMPPLPNDQTTTDSAIASDAMPPLPDDQTTTEAAAPVGLAPSDAAVQPAQVPPAASDADDGPILSNPLDDPNALNSPPSLEPPSTAPENDPQAAPPLFGEPSRAPSGPGGSDPDTRLPRGGIPPALPEDPLPNSPLPSLILGDMPLPLDPEDAPAEITPGTQRVVGIFPRDSSKNFSIQELPLVGQTRIVVIQGGVNIVMETGPQFGTVDLSADRIVLWITDDDTTKASMIDPSGQFKQSNQAPLEVYLEGNVIYRMDERKVAGNGDERLVRAETAYYDARNDRFTAMQAELNIFAPGLLAPIRTKADRISQWRSAETGVDGILQIGRPIIDVTNTSTTGSRFPNPGYKFNSELIRITQDEVPLRNPITGSLDPGSPATDYEWKLDARRNRFYIGALPVLYLPRVVMTPEDLDLPLKQLQFRTNNYFGQQVLSDWSMFKVLGLKKPAGIDNWNLDLDYLSARGPAVGSEIGYFGRDALGGRIPGSFFGYADGWAIWDTGNDVLGTGPAVITDPVWAGNRGFQRSDIPNFYNLRGRTVYRHMQSLLGEDAAFDEDTRFQVEFGYLSDRYFLEQYYKRLNDTGLDHQTSVYAIRQTENQALSILAKGNLQEFYTDTQWLPKLDYYRIGDSFLGDILTHHSHSGADYANVHTDVMVNNPNLFAFQPYDPISQTSGAFGSGRIWTSHEVDMPLNLGPFKFTPYAQGQAIGWAGQYNEALPAYTVPPADVQQLIRSGNDRLVGRLWGAAGARGNIMLWRAYEVESEILNVHGLNHKMNFGADYRNAYSTLPLTAIGVQDELDDNSYEFVRRYFAFTNYGGGVLPPQYNPLLLATRRNLSPITGTTDVLESMQTVQLNWNQRLQTKRGPEGARRVIDWMIFDLSTTYFPQADRDNFGKDWGLNTYNWEWYVGDRTTVFSNGWFEFWDVEGQALNKTNPNRTNDPFGMKIITTGFSSNRPPKGNATVSYTILQTGEVNTSALNLSYSYWISPKWYSTFMTSYDFGNGISLGSNVSVTRIGADYLTSIGLAIDPQRQSTMVAVEVTPRLSPNLRLGQSAGPRFDSRFAPTQ